MSIELDEPPGRADDSYPGQIDQECCAVVKWWLSKRAYNVRDNDEGLDLCTKTHV